MPARQSGCKSETPVSGRYCSETLLFFLSTGSWLCGESCRLHMLGQLCDVEHQELPLLGALADGVRVARCSWPRSCLPAPVTFWFMQFLQSAVDGHVHAGWAG